MNKNLTEYKNKMNTDNKKDYDREYKKTMYKQLKFEVKPDFYEIFNNYCEDHGIKKAELLRNAILEYIENHL